MKNAERSNNPTVCLACLNVKALCSSCQNSPLLIPGFCNLRPPREYMSDTPAALYSALYISGNGENNAEGCSSAFPEAKKRHRKALFLWRKAVCIALFSPSNPFTTINRTRLCSLRVYKKNWFHLHSAYTFRSIRIDSIFILHTHIHILGQCKNASLANSFIPKLSSETDRREKQ